MCATMPALRCDRHRHAAETITPTEPPPACAPPPLRPETLRAPVYSLSTKARAGGKAKPRFEFGPDTDCDTMNLLSYCMPMTVDRKQLVLGLYKGTQSYSNIFGGGVDIDALHPEFCSADGEPYGILQVRSTRL
jgi:hypothetical protein